MGLLSGLMSAADSSKRYIKGLLANPSDTLNAWADRNIQAYTKPNTNEMVGNYLGAGVSAPIGALGMTVWHGSPHKFDKFDMSKIGTGEGAQAYGHGLYFAESPAVAKSYQDNLAPGWKPTYTLKGKDASTYYNEAVRKGNYGDAMLWEQIQLHRTRDSIRETLLDEIEGGSDQAKQALKKLDTLPNELFAVPDGAMYKVDIPDEAVARFLDWDKPLSEQAPEVQAAFEQWGALQNGRWNFKGYTGSADNLTGRQAWESMFGALGPKASDVLKKQNIPGIRYLDGGSRSAGDGTSNFVLFDDALARILERNGQATGLQPWQPGEWGGLLK